MMRHCLFAGEAVLIRPFEPVVCLLSVTTPRASTPSTISIIQHKCEIQYVPTEPDGGGRNPVPFRSTGMIHGRMRGETGEVTAEDDGGLWSALDGD